MPKPQTIPAAKSNPSMGVMDAIRNRHAVRSYTDKPVDKASIRILLEAAVRAPTAVHEEPWAFAVIQDRAFLQRLSEKAKDSMGELAGSLHVPGRLPSSHFTPPENIFYNAGTLIVIYGKPLSPFVVADCWLAAENLMLAACAMGLGTCVIGLAVPALNTLEWKAELKVPADMTVYALIIVGAPSGETPSTSRKEPEILVWK